MLMTPDPDGPVEAPSELAFEEDGTVLFEYPVGEPEADVTTVVGTVEADAGVVVATPTEEVR